MKCDKIRTRAQGDTPFFPNMLNNCKVEVCLKEDVDAAIAEKDAEIAELKQKLEDAKATAYAESIDSGMENRKLKRELWMHRAITAKFNKEACKAMREYNPFIGIEEYKWQEVERKCFKKAEEYK